MRNYRDCSRLREAMLGALLSVAALAGSAAAQNNPDWTEPFPPFRIAGAAITKSVRRLSAGDVYQMTGISAPAGGIEVVLGR